MIMVEVEPIVLASVVEVQKPLNHNILKNYSHKSSSIAFISINFVKIKVD